MPNTLTAVQPILFAAQQQVSRELTGMLTSITLDAQAAQVAKGDVVKIPYAPALAAADFTPAATSTEGTSVTASSVSLSITKLRKVSWHLTGEQEQSLANGGNSLEWVRQMLAQGMRTLANEAEADAIIAAKEGASRAYGTAGTTPFGSTPKLTDAANVLKMLKDNGAPSTDLSLVINTAAGLNLRSLDNIVQAYAAGTDAAIRQGVLLDLFGLKVKESGGIVAHTKGTGASYVTSGSTAPGVTDIALVTGTGTVLAGDVVTFAADANNKYVVGAGVAAPGTISLNRPGARVTIATANALTVGNTYTPNIALHKGAVIGAVRPPKLSANGFTRVMSLTDPETALPFVLVELDQYGQTTWELHLAWGFKAVQSEHIVTLLG